MAIDRTAILFFLFVSGMAFGQKANDTMKYEDFVALCKINRLETKYPPVNGKTVNGKTLSEGILKGKIIVINIWTKACRPCIAEIPGLDSLAKRYKDKKVAFIAISSESETFIKDNYISQNKFSYEHLIFPEDTVTYKYFGFAFPLNIVLDTNGIVKYFKYGGIPNSKGADLVYKDIEAVIEELRK